MAFDSLSRGAMQAPVSGAAAVEPEGANETENLNETRGKILLPVPIILLNSFSTNLLKGVYLPVLFPHRLQGMQLLKTGGQ